MPIEVRSLVFNDHVVYREIRNGTLPEWLFRELLSVRVAAGDGRSSVLVIQGGEPLVVMTKRDLDTMLERAWEQQNGET
jgi:hypothetical protein